MPLSSAKATAIAVAKGTDGALYVVADSKEISTDGQVGHVCKVSVAGNTVVAVAGIETIAISRGTADTVRLEALKIAARAAQHPGSLKEKALWLEHTYEAELRNLVAGVDQTTLVRLSSKGEVDFVLVKVAEGAGPDILVVSLVLRSKPRQGFGVDYEISALNDVSKPAYFGVNDFKVQRAIRSPTTAASLRGYVKEMAKVHSDTVGLPLTELRISHDAGIRYVAHGACR
jgi:hypothetical protein